MNYETNPFGQIIEYVDEDALRDFNDASYDILGVERIALDDLFLGLTDSEHFVILDRYTDQIKAGTVGFYDDDALMKFVRNWQAAMADYDDDDADYMVYVGPAA